MIPSNLTVGSGLFALGSDVNGYMSLALTGQKSRLQLRLQDGLAVVRELSSNNSGQLVWDGTPIPSLNGLAVASPIALISNGLDATWLSIAGNAGYQRPRIYRNL